MNKLKGYWEDMCGLIIRPQRCDYDITNLGHQLFRIGVGIYERTDLTILNPRGMALQCSHFEPTQAQRPSAKMPCVVYLHGNCGSRQDATECVTVLLPHGISLFTFDFSGSGLSEGEYVSLGYFEKQDLVSVIDYLNEKGNVSRIGLWGRSMGAVTSIMYSSKDHSISSIVCDSPFSSLQELMQDLVMSYKPWIPRWMLRIAINTMRASITKKAHFDINDLDTTKYASQCPVPMLLGHAKDDQLVPISHAKTISERYQGECSLMEFDGGHNSDRPEVFLSTVATFFTHHLINKSAPTRREASSSASPARSHVDPIAGLQSPSHLESDGVLFNDEQNEDELAALLHTANQSHQQEEKVPETDEEKHLAAEAAERAEDVILARQAQVEEERCAAELERLKAEEESLAAEAAEAEKLAAERKVEEERLAAEAEKQAEEERLAAEKKAEEERLAAEAERLAAEKAEEERLAAEAEAEKLAAEKKAEEERLAAEAEKQAEEERLAAEKKAEEERLAAEAEEAERLAAEKAEEERLAKEAAEAEKLAAERKAEEEKLAAEAEAEKLAAEKKAEEERLAAEKQAEEERLAAEKKAEEERLAAEAAEAERRAAEKAEEERLAAEKAEEDRLAKEAAEAEKLAAEKKAEEERLAAEAEKQAEEERLVAEKKAEEERLAAEAAEAERLAAEKAEEERLAKEAAEAEKLVAEKKAEEERLAAEAEKQAEEEKLAAEKQAEEERLAAEAAEAERVAKMEEESLAAEEETKVAEEKEGAESAEEEKPSAEGDQSENEKETESQEKEQTEEKTPTDD